MSTQPEPAFRDRKGAAPLLSEAPAELRRGSPSTSEGLGINSAEGRTERSGEGVRRCPAMKRVKAWAVILWNEHFSGAYSTRKQAQDFINEYDLHDVFEVVPCTILYPPPPSKGKPKKRV